MPLDPALRAKQSTDTTGTGTLVLNAAPAAMRSLAAAFGGVAARLRYVISWSTGFELGYGDFNGASPGTLTRASVIASSNANALVALPVGTKDVFLWQDTGARPLITVTAAYTVTLADLGNVIHFIGSSPAALTLPAFATVPIGAGVQVQNSGTAAYTATANGAETIDGATTYVVAPGTSVMILRVAAGWAKIANLPGATAIGAAVAAAADAAAARSALGAPAIPTTSAGPGQVVLINPGLGANVMLPAGGTWLFFAQNFLSSGAYNFVQVFLRAAGGSVIAIGAANSAFIGWAWRIE